MDKFLFDKWDHEVPPSVFDEMQRVLNLPMLFNFAVLLSSQVAELPRMDYAEFYESLNHRIIREKPQCRFHDVP